MNFSKFLIQVSSYKLQNVDNYVQLENNCAHINLFLSEIIAMILK
jgi:hypothetical protein